MSRRISLVKDKEAEKEAARQASRGKIASCPTKILERTKAQMESQATEEKEERRLKMSLKYRLVYSQEGSLYYEDFRSVKRLFEAAVQLHREGCIPELFLQVEGDREDLIPNMKLARVILRFFTVREGEKRKLKPDFASMLLAYARKVCEEEEVDG